MDPWLVGDLSFFEQGWLYTGKKRGFGGGSGVQIDVREVASDTDVVLITQVSEQCSSCVGQQLRLLHWSNMARKGCIAACRTTCHTWQAA